MSIIDIMSNQVSTRFLLAIFSLIGVFVYGHVAEADAGEVFGVVKFIVGAYGLNKAIEHGAGVIKK